MTSPVERSIFNAKDAKRAKVSGKTSRMVLNKGMLRGRLIAPSARRSGSAGGQ
jgi:hypothetical protein